MAIAFGQALTKCISIHNGIALLQQLPLRRTLPPRLPRVPLKSRHQRQCLWLLNEFMLARLYLYSLWKGRA